MILLKSEAELDLMRKAGKILARILEKLERKVAVGLATGELGRLAEEYILGEGVTPAFKGYHGYPSAICVSINEEIVHGIPGSRVIQDGDLVSLDLGIAYQGFFVDTALTLGAGKISPRAKELIRATRQSLSEGIKQARAGNRLGDISCAIQKYVEDAGFSVVREFVGHGIGAGLHEEPEIPNFGSAHQGPLLQSGMVLAIEPMVNMGHWKAKILSDGWTAVAEDGLPSAHFEHTVAITRRGPEILTM